MSEEDLSLVRSEMLAALNIFLEHVKYTITLMATVLAAGVALFAYGLQAQLSVITERVLIVSAVGCGFSVAGLAVISERIVRRYYKIYASNYIYSARLHHRAGRDVMHPWVADLARTGVKDVNAADAVDRFMSGRGQERHSWYYYKLIVWVLGIVGIVAALTGIGITVG